MKKWWDEKTTWRVWRGILLFGGTFLLIYLGLDRRSEAAMIDMQASPEKFRADATEAALIRDLATDSSKRELFGRLSVHLATLATEIERAIAGQSSE
jgi:hypothetical protein